MTSFDYDGNTYELKLTRAGAREAESQGMRASDLTEKPMSALYHLFFAALYSKYRMTPNKSAAMLDHILDNEDVVVSELYEELVEAYSDLFGVGESKE